MIAPQTSFSLARRVWGNYIYIVVEPYDEWLIIDVIHRNVYPDVADAKSGNEKMSMIKGISTPKDYSQRCKK